MKFINKMKINLPVTQNTKPFPQGTYLVQANGCQADRRFANRFLGGSAEPAGARTVATAPSLSARPKLHQP